MSAVEKKRADGNVILLHKIEGEEEGLTLSRSIISPEVSAGLTIANYSSSPGQTELRGLVSALEEQSKAVASGSLERAETMLTSQAHTLDAIFNKMSVLSAANLSKSLDIAERLMRLGLKAQSQARATLEALALIKNPPVVYARHANVTSGPQQNNFGLPSRAETEIKQTQLSESTHELCQDSGTPGIEGRANPPLDAVGTIDRAKVARG